MVKPRIPNVAKGEERTLVVVLTLHPVRVAFLSTSNGIDKCRSRDLPAGQLNSRG